MHKFVADKVCRNKKLGLRKAEYQRLPIMKGLLYKFVGISILLALIGFSINVSATTFGLSYLPDGNKLIEDDAVMYAKDELIKLVSKDTTGWMSIPASGGTKSLNYTMADVGVETGNKTCMGVGGSKTIKLYAKNTTKVLHLNTGNITGVRVYGIINAQYTGIQILANKVSDITDGTLLTDSELEASYYYGESLASNKTVPFIVNLTGLDPQEDYIITIKGYSNLSTSIAYIYAIKLYANDTPAIRVISGDTTISATAKEAMEEVVLRWTNPSTTTGEANIQLHCGEEYDTSWLNYSIDNETKTIRLSGTPPDNSSATSEPIAYDIILGSTIIGTGTLTVNKHTDPAPEFTTKEKNRSVTAGNDLSFSINVKNATGVAKTTGLPDWASVKYENGTITISGTSTTPATGDIGSPYPATYDYQITAAGLADYEGTPVIYNGTITVIDPTAKKVAFVYTADDISDMDVRGKIYNVVNTRYNVTPIKSESVGLTDETIFNDYDMILLHESANSSSPGAQNIGTWVGTKPVLNTKAHMYGKTNWPLMSTSITDAGEDFAIVSDIYSPHTIFSGIGLINDTLKIGGNIRGVLQPGQKLSTQYVIGKNSDGNATIVEENNGEDGANKYMMIAIAADNEEKGIAEELTSEGINLFKNACEYLLSTHRYTTEALSNEADILSFTLGTGTGVINGTDITVELLSDTTDVTNLRSAVPMIIASDNATIINGDAKMDFSNEQTVTYKVRSEDKENEKEYNVTVKLTDGTIKAPYLDSIAGCNNTEPVDYYNKPAGIYSKQSVLSYMPQYAREDAGFWTENCEEIRKASVLRINANDIMTILAKDPGIVTIGVSATGAREINTYIDGVMISTTNMKSATKTEVTISVNQTGVHEISLENVGTGGSTIGFIKITKLASSDSGETEKDPEAEAKDTEAKVIDEYYYTTNGRQTNEKTSGSVIIRVRKMDNGKTISDKIIERD